MTDTAFPAPAERVEPAATGELTRAISRNMLLLLVVGDVLGAGIYALIGEVGGRVGGPSGPRSWWRWPWRCSPLSPTPSW